MDTKRIEPIRYENGRKMLLTGLSRRFTMETRSQIGALWVELAPHLGHIPHAAAGMTSYGISSGIGGDEFVYFCGDEVTSPADLPDGLIHFEVPAQPYAVFEHKEHLDTLSQTFDSIWNEWFPRSGRVKGKYAIEVYGPEFDPRTMLGGIELWIALEED